ncbi:MAG: tetratricopeptide repeat protein [Phenylobacterium sp.]|nr:MAG: tetratricopeptide repeat protein [Phenylobacterium sp.]
MRPEPSASEDPAPALRRAMADHARGRLAEAEAAYRGILARDPDEVRALGLLALILADGPDEAEAERILARHLALRPDDDASLLALGRLSARRGDDVAAVALFRRAATARPGLAPIHNELGVSLHRLGDHAQALAAFDRALAIDPAYAVAHGNRGLVLQARGRPRLAARALRRALRSGAEDAGLWEALASVLDQDRRAQAARVVRDDLARRTGVQRSGRTDAAAPRVLVLGAVGAGHVPTRYLVDPDAFAIAALTLLSPQARDASLGRVALDELRDTDVVFSTLGDVDRDGGQLSAATAFCLALDKPVLNPPAAIRHTGRDAAAALFAGIPGLVTPPARRASPAELAATPIETPLLVRPAGDHGGQNLVRLQDAAERDAYLATRPDERLLLTPFHDVRSADGRWRKYRFVFVDRRPFPFHLAIADHWLVHYWRADMAGSAEARAEEARFLADWRGVFGPRAAAAVEAVARRLDLDYGGLDCALTEAGEVLLFEANACILLHLDDPADVFPYKHRAVPPIREAFTRLVLDRARGR